MYVAAYISMHTWLCTHMYTRVCVCECLCASVCVHACLGESTLKAEQHRNFYVRSSLIRHDRIMILK